MTLLEHLQRNCGFTLYLTTRVQTQHLGLCCTPSRACLPTHKSVQGAPRKHMPVLKSVAGPRLSSPPFSQAPPALVLPAATTYSRAAVHQLTGALYQPPPFPLQEDKKP